MQIGSLDTENLTPGMKVTKKVYFFQIRTGPNKWHEPYIDSVQHGQVGFEKLNDAKRYEITQSKFYTATRVVERTFTIETREV